ncbi:galanin receptor 2b-like [Saccoglossus kowalevskii]|uniref:Cholecystokinin receptor type A-like n=1 Tax=Saccoglossus kowalevskii TaxID=10224 RepID=A0ABM0M472_SACKO|nr:PREDICTED: cholecystokinin receptor type A-like [Saccoglossus kowalevskii]
MNDTMNETTSPVPTSLPSNGSPEEVQIGQIVLKVIYATFGSLGIIGNLLVCVVFIKIKTMRKTHTNVFIFNQSLIDLSSSIIFVTLKFGPEYDVIPDSVSGDLYCKVWSSEYILWGLFIASTFNLSFLSLERYLAICHPVLHRNKVTLTKVKIIIITTWFIGFIRESYWPTMNFNENGVCSVKEWPNTGMQILVGCIAFATEYILPLGIMAFSYGNIIKELRRRTKPIEVQPATVSGQRLAPPNQPEAQQQEMRSKNSQENQTTGQSTASTHKPKEDSMGRARKNVTKTMLIVSVTFIICWSPMSISFFVYNLGGPLDYDAFYYWIMVVMVFFNMCINPFIYAIKYKQFRDGVRTVFRCNKNKVWNIEESTQSTTA